VRIWWRAAHNPVSTLTRTTRVLQHAGTNTASERHNNTAMTIPQEHQSLNIEFGIISNGNTSRAERTKNHSHAEVNERLPRTTVAMPTVTLSTHRKSRPHHSDNHRSNSSGCSCSMARLSRWTILGLVVFYANELSSSFKFFHPTVRSTPHVRGDYSSIRGIHDLQSSHIRPKCFVSSCVLLCALVDAA
jgi:hypothetical protein